MTAKVVGGDQKYRKLATTTFAAGIPLTVIYQSVLSLVQTDTSSSSTAGNLVSRTPTEW